MADSDETVAPEGFETVKVCPDCSEAVEDGDSEPLYECPECGDTFPMSEGDGGGFSNNRSPCCGKYSRRAGDAHANCGGNLEDASERFKCEECDEILDTVEDCGPHRRDEHPTPEEDEDRETDEDKPTLSVAAAAHPGPWRIVTVDSHGNETVVSGPGA